MNDNQIVGARIKQLREARSMSVGQLAERSGLDLSQVSRIENDAILPSLAPLIKIARALGVRLGTFMDDQEGDGPIISRNNTHRKPIGFSNNDVNSHKHMDYFSLSEAKAGRHMEPFIIHVEPAREGADFIVSSHEGEEFIYCLEGALEIKYGKDTYILEEGDSIYYDSIVAHHVHAADESGAKILAVVYTPI